MHTETLELCEQDVARLTTPMGELEELLALWNDTVAPALAKETVTTREFYEAVKISNRLKAVGSSFACAIGVTHTQAYIRAVERK